MTEALRDRIITVEEPKTLCTEASNLQSSFTLPTIHSYFLFHSTLMYGNPV